MAMANYHPDPVHTYGAKCRLAAVARPWARMEDDVPPAHPQYFYSSPISIDDPLSPSLIAGSTEAKTTRGPLRPFSPGDNNALERAWLTIANDKDRRSHRAALHSDRDQLGKDEAETISHAVKSLVARHSAAHGRPSRPDTPTADDAPIPVCCPELATHVQAELESLFCPLVRQRYRALQEENVIQEVMMRVRALAVEEPASGGPEAAPPRAQSLRSHNVSEKEGINIRKRLGRDSVDVSNSMRSASPVSKSPSPLAIPVRPPVMDDGVTGMPFARMGSSDNTQQQQSAPSSFRRPDSPVGPAMREKRGSQHSIPESRGGSKPTTPRPKEAEDQDLTTNANPDGRQISIEVPVGVSRLHMVSLPRLEMKPIYWSPVNDIAVVLRATWFYSETMVPVDPIVANQLELGYRELKPHTETWNDELRCAIEVGPLGEEKVIHKLWPKPRGTDGSEPEPAISRDPFCAARCYRGEASAEGHLEAVGVKESQVPLRPFSNYHVFYKDERSAFLLKPSLRPSAYYNRKPVAKILKGHMVGVPVQRGFDWSVWERVHDRKKSPTPPSNQPASAAAEGLESTGAEVCLACKLEKEKGQVTDLVLVAHGIGQKFAERVESFHFTHAINAFRREINIELASPAVKAVLRQGQNGIMVLPVNWRHTLSFEDGGPMREEDKSAYVPEGFSLKNIEPTTIPAVRSLISDVMFDIPFYMSHHKRKMIEALVVEANRVYRLWCRNNPGFADRGRVHLIGHSLGSAMAIEVLSRQPTRVPRLNLDAPQPQCSFFEFDTRNLFLLGSPAGFFLLLERGALMPRRGRMKPGADPSDVVAKGVVGEEGLFGCLAVDNVYNILAKEDPIAYLLNGTIDPAYATSLKVAYVPSATSSIFKSMGNAVRNLVPGLPPATNSQAAAAKPSAVRLPSQLELEVHDFTREEIAEKKAFLLNDNGQIDFFLRSTGGPLEIQYLNMLSAHTSYWAHQDLIRMLCMEIGREPGRENTLPSMRAVKNTKSIAASLASQ